MKAFTTLASLAVLTSVIGVAQAAPTALAPVTMTVTGTIKAGTCTPTVLGDADYQNIDRGSLSATSYTALASKSLTLKVDCTAPSKFMVKVIDNRSAAAPAAGNLPVNLSNGGLMTTLPKESYLGLANASGGAPVGAYALSFGAPTVDTQLQLIGSTSDAGTSAAESSVSLLYSSNLANRFGASRNNAIVTGKNYTFPIHVSASIARTGDLPNENIVLDGAATLELHFI